MNNTIKVTENVVVQEITGQIYHMGGILSVIMINGTGEKEKFLFKCVHTEWITKKCEGCKKIFPFEDFPNYGESLCVNCITPVEDV